MNNKTDLLQQIAEKMEGKSTDERIRTIDSRKSEKVAQKSTRRFETDNYIPEERVPQTARGMRNQTTFQGDTRVQRRRSHRPVDPAKLRTPKSKTKAGR